MWAWDPSWSSELSQFSSNLAYQTYCFDTNAEVVWCQPISKGVFWSYPRRCFGWTKGWKKSRHAISPRRGANGVYVNEFIHNTMLSELEI